MNLNSVTEDLVLLYAKGTGWDISLYNVLVEGITDRNLLMKAVALYQTENGENLLRDGLSFVCSGKGDLGGASGVARELTVMRALSRHILTSRGFQKYRFVGLVDDDEAGRRAVKGMRATDASAQEYRDIFRLRPEMVCSGNADVGTLAQAFNRLNSSYRNLRWEIEDLLEIEFIKAFLDENPMALIRKQEMYGKVHWEFTYDGKHQLHRFIHEHAMVNDLKQVVDLIHSLRFCLGLSI